MNSETDLYSILELNKNSSLVEIKQNFKKLALKYHPDKYKHKDANEKFNKIRVAYEILSNPNKKEKYDNMIEPKKKHFINKILLFLREITDPLTLNNLIVKIDLTDDIKNGNIGIIANKIIQKLLDEIEDDSDIIQLSEIFIKKDNNNSNENKSIRCSLSKVSSIESSIKTSCTISYNTSNYNTLNIFGNIKVKLEDIYNNSLKEIIVKRKIINNNILDYETNKYIIPLYNNHVTITNAGDKIINQNEIDTGNVILKINYEKNDKISRMKNNLLYNNNNNKYYFAQLYGIKWSGINNIENSSQELLQIHQNTNDIIISPLKIKYNLIYKDYITLYSLFNILDININIFNNIINIKSDNPLNDYIFDGEKLIIIIKGKGLPYNNNNSRGDLLIYLYLIKDDNFMKLLDLTK